MLVHKTIEFLKEYASFAQKYETVPINPIFSIKTKRKYETVPINPILKSFSIYPGPAWEPRGWASIVTALKTNELLKENTSFAQKYETVPINSIFSIKTNRKYETVPTNPIFQAFSIYPGRRRPNPWID